MKTIFSLTIALLTMCAPSTSHAMNNVEFINSKATIENNLPFSEMIKVGDLIFMSGQIDFDRESRRVGKLLRVVFRQNLIKPWTTSKIPWNVMAIQ